MAEPPPTITEEFIETVAGRVAAGLRTRRSLPGWGRINIERQLPFLVVYRRPGHQDRATYRMAIGHAAYLTADSARSLRRGVRALAARVGAEQARIFGSALVVEIWANPELSHESREALGGSGPAFRLHASRDDVKKHFVRNLAEELRRITIAKRSADVGTRVDSQPAPPGLRPLLSPPQMHGTSVHLIGLEVAPIYLDSDGTEFPLVRRELRRQLTRALSIAFFQFARDETKSRPRSYHALGRQATVKAVWKIDSDLAAIGSSYDLLLLVTPVNGEAAWAEFRRKKYERIPTFYYRPSPVDPSDLKRRLHEVRIGRVEDPTIADLFHQQREALDRQLSLLRDREKPSFLYDSLALHGRVDDQLWALALRILELVPPTDRANGARVDGEKFAAVAEEELSYYRSRVPDLNARVEIRDDITSLMVSGGNLLVARGVRIPKSRVEALLHHELGTHLVTSYNGRQQRLRLLASGLAGYDALQEGLGVFAEYLSGGLSKARVRLLAGRVVGSRLIVEGAEFVDTFRELTNTHGFGKRVAFAVTTRIYRGGGFVKDAVYLRGLREVFQYVQQGGNLDTLLAGKMAMSHVPIIEELQRRKVLVPPVIRPRYLEGDEARRKLDWIRTSPTVEEIIGELWK